jgi:Ca2+-binding EF-hand superfamily protein
MKNHTLLAAGALALALTASMSAGDHKAVFQAMDANGDGNLTRAEHQAYTRSLFQKGDADRDGGITAAEWDVVAVTIPGEKMSAEATAAQLQKMDTDKDNKVSLSESEACATTAFTEADTNNDGQLTQAEFDAINDKMKEKAAR